MIASVYIKDGKINFYNEQLIVPRRHEFQRSEAGYNESNGLSNVGGIEYELGKPLLNFVCYEPEMFLDAFYSIVEAFDNEYAHVGATENDFIAGIQESFGELQNNEPYIYFYAHMLMEFVYNFIESPWKAVLTLEEKIPGAEDKLRWVVDFTWQSPPPGKVFADKEKRLFRAAKDAVTVMHEYLCKFQRFIINEIEILLHYRKEIKVPEGRSIDYIDILDEYHMHKFNVNYYLEKPFQTFYGRVATKEIEQLYVIDDIEDLFRFEFIGI
jgi:hypothetical protein